MAGLVLPVVRADGTPAVLKLQPPAEEISGVAAGLRAWDGDGVVRCSTSIRWRARSCGSGWTRDARCRASRTTPRCWRCWPGSWRGCRRCPRRRGCAGSPTSPPRRSSGRPTRWCCCAIRYAVGQTVGGAGAAGSRRSQKLGPGRRRGVRGRFSYGVRPPATPPCPWAAGRRRPGDRWPAGRRCGPGVRRGHRPG
ncbi:hypothetical protein [Streptomyces sp. NPDC088706]